LHRFDLDTNQWSEKLAYDDIKRRLAYGFCEYKDHLYMIRGYDKEQENSLDTTYRLNLKSETKKWESFNLGNFEHGAAFGYVCDGHKVYIYGGLSNIGYTNQLVELNLEKADDANILSNSMKIPTPRFGHGMILYDEKLIILGGVDKDGNE
jgi:hypothetical protein